MSAQVVQLKPLSRSGWSPREFGEFYRVESALIQAGLRIDTDCGLSDEGDPWFVFCRADDGEVIIHIARIHGIYILASAAYAGVASGRDIIAMVRDLIEKHPLVEMSGQTRGSKIFLHPAALLIAVVAAAFFKSSEARALSPNHLKTGETRGETARAGPIPTSEKTVVISAEQGAVVLSAILTALSLETAPADKAVSAPNAEFLTSSFVNSSGFSTGATHAIDLVLKPQNLHGDGDLAVEPLPAAHSGAMAEAIPLFTLLCDLAKTAAPPVTVAHEIEHSSSSGHGATHVDSLVLSVTFGPSRADSALPAVHATSLCASLHSNADFHDFNAYSHASGVVAATTRIVETNTPSQLDQLSSALITALKAASHSLFAIPEGGTAPFAAALVSFLTQHGSTDAELINSNSTNPNPSTTNSSTTELHFENNPGQASTSFGGVAPSNEVSTGSTPHSSIDASPSQPSGARANVEFLVQEFFAHTSHFQTITAGLHVVVYDTDAIMTHPPSELASVAFDFSDGSMLSLVGLPAALQHSVIVG